jgi:hypothetical protein
VDLDRPQLTVKGRAEKDAIYMPDNRVIIEAQAYNI